MKTNVTILSSRNRPDVEPTVYATEDDARDALYVEVASSWDNVFCLDGQDCGVPGCIGVPAAPDELDRDTAIRAYLNHRPEDRCDIIGHEVDIPFTALLGDWAARAQHAIDTSYAESPGPVPGSGAGQ